MINNLAEYEKAANLMPGSVIIFQLNEDDTMKVFFYSKKALEMTGMERSEVEDTLSHDGFNMIIEDDKKIIIEKVKKAIANHEELDITYRQHHKELGIAWIHMRASIAGEVEGKPTFIASMLDVTAEMLSSSNIMEASGRAICVIDKKTKLLLYGNSLFYALNHMKRSDSMGVHCYDALCGNPAFKTNNRCLCFSTINIEVPFEYYNPENKQYTSMYGREIMWGEHEAYVFYMTDQTEEKFKEKQLKNAQERFELTLENSDLFVWEYDIINSQCINSEKAVRDYGIPRVIDHYPESLYEMGHTPPETVEQIKEVKQRLLNGESDFSVERRTIDAKGVSQWMKVSYTLEKDAYGRPIRALVCGTDITELKHKQAEYEEAIRLKKMVSENTTILCVLDLTLDRVVENDVKNPILERYLKQKFSVNEIMNSICDNLVAPSEQEAYRAHFSRENMLNDFEHGVTHGILRHQFSHRVGWFESVYDLIQNPTSGNVEAVTSIKDVTDEVRSKQVINKLTAIDYDMIFTVDVETGEAYRYDKADDMESTTEGRKFGREEYENFTKSVVKKTCSLEEAKKFAMATSEKNVIEILNKMPIYTFMFTLNNKNEISRKRYIYTYLDQSHKTILCARQDVTESYLLEEKQKLALSEALQRAEIANDAKTSFLSRVSHDMRTPLNGMLGLTELMKSENVSSRMMRDLKNLELSGKYLLDLINDVLDVNSIETGNMKLNPVLCDGQMVMDNLVKLIKPIMDAKNIEFVIKTEEMTFVPTIIDEARLQQIAMNVLGNAAKFTHEGGQVEFTCRTLSIHQEVIVNEFIVKDNGIGMESSFIPHLFEPFSQENAEITNSKNGTGLGMSITKRIVELMKGTIEVESEKNVGTTVRVRLNFPIATQEQIDSRKVELQPSQSFFNLKGRRVLICEDHPLNQQISSRLLEKVGVMVECADNGQVGLTLFENSEVGYYDAILMDIRMPIMDGLTTTRLLRQLDKADAQTIPIIAMSANAFAEDVEETRKAGMNAHLSKPVQSEILYKTIDELIKKRK